MKYSAILFDWGDTLAPVRNGIPSIMDWVPDMIQDLYRASYRLGIISNTHRYQDGWWIRNELAKRDVLQYFEVVIASATYGHHKPSMKIFHQAVDFLEVPSVRAIMVGDSERCDGGSQALRMDFFHVPEARDWSKELYKVLGETFPKNRKLTPVVEFETVSLPDENGNYGISLKLRHLSEPLNDGDRFMLDGKEHEVVKGFSTTKAEIIRAKEDTCVLTVRELS
jgi:FMN phosphatase YigB (HAD superfamily)